LSVASLQLAVTPNHQNRPQSSSVILSARGARIRKPFYVLRLHSLKYAARNPQNSLTDQTRSKPPDPYPIKPSSSHPALPQNAMGRRQRIPSSPIHISKNKPDQPASTPLSESIHLPIQCSFSKSSRAKNPGARNLAKPPKFRKSFFAPPRR